MFEQFKENFLNMVTSRLFILFLLMLLVSGVMVHRIFDLQIVHGEEYLDTFQLKIMKERTIPATRGNIYDRNGNLLAYNDLSYSVTIEDVYESGKTKNAKLNETIYRLINIIERNGDKTVSDFKIILDNDNNYKFTVEDKQLKRFLADVYGHSKIEDLEYKEVTATPEDVINFLCANKKFGIGNFREEGKTDTFEVGLGYTRAEVLKILTIRYDMNSNSYQKYIATTVATNVSEETVAVVMENSDILSGVSITEDTIRKYVDNIFFSQVMGYTGKVSQDELETLRQENGEDSYDMNDTVGKLGIENAMETTLQGKKGRETVFVNNVGKVISTSDYHEPIAGDDVYLTIDKDLQEVAYHILEENIASILIAKIRNVKEYTHAENAASSSMIIPIYDVYFALINNNVINTEHFKESTAGENEAAVYAVFLKKKEEVLATLAEELETLKTPYESLPQEYQVYESFIAELLYTKGVIPRAKINTSDAKYIAWTTDEVISLNEYINYCISKNWIDVTKLGLKSNYWDSEEIYSKIIEFIIENLDSNSEFAKKIYKYMIKEDRISGRQICSILLEQDVVEVGEEEEQQFRKGAVSPYDFMMMRISNLEITPAQLALDPYSGSLVVTDVNNGDVLALVSYPSYDNNKMANGVDAEYFSKLLNDLSTPMINYATQQKTAPGSTFKMVSATAGLIEGAIAPASTYACHGIFDRITPPPRCWIHPRGGTHGTLNVTGGIGHSCNVFFFELGYRLGMTDDVYSSDAGLASLAKYADLYGLSETSGIEIEESVPQMSTVDAVRSAIGQGNSNYTTIGLARYVTAVANSGTCYELTLVDRVGDHSGNTLKEYSANIRNTVEMDAANWKAIQQGMRQVVEGKSYFSNLAVHVAGKTGTAEENANRAPHALFVCYAPYEQPEIAITTRVAFGYSSDYAAQIAREVVKYYYGLAEEDEIVKGAAGQLEGGAMNAD